MAGSAAREIWNVSALHDALLEVGLSPTLAATDAPESGVQPTLQAAPRVKHPANATATGRDVLPWAAHMAAALAPTLLTHADQAPKSEPRPSGIVRRGPAAVPFARPHQPPPLLLPLPPPPPAPAVRPRTRGAARWPVRLCGLVALAMSAAAFVESPLPESSQVRSGLRVGWGEVVGVSSRLTQKLNAL
jgi:hypothetical protein